jgi:phosphoglycolate phosphatase
MTGFFIGLQRAVRPVGWTHLAIFDLDGTLVDSAPDIAAALNAALDDQALAPFALDEVTRMVGAGARVLMERALAARCLTPDTSQVEALLAGFLDHYDANPCRFTRPYRGVVDTLPALIEDGWALAVCTNKPEAIARQVLQGLGLHRRFLSIVGGRAGVPLKPAPEMIGLCLTACAVGAGQAVMIGDSAADLGAARASGIPAILMTHGYSDRPVATLGAHFDELLPALNRLRA